MKKKTIMTLIKIITFLGIAIVAMVYVYQMYHSFVEQLPGFEQAIMDDVLPGIDEPHTFVIFEDQILNLEHYPIVTEGTIYLPLAMIQTYLDDEFYFDEAEGILTYTTRTKVYRLSVGATQYTINGEPFVLEKPIEYQNGGVLYLPTEVLSKFKNLQYTYNRDLDLLMMDDPTKDYATIRPRHEGVYLRTFPKHEARYSIQMGRNDILRVYDEDEGWYYVRNQEGLFGYIPVGAAAEYMLHKGMAIEDADVDYRTTNHFKGGINLVWHLLTIRAANDNIYTALDNVHGLDVISPTWFEITGTDGKVSSIASKDYVDYAHAQGVDVWALFSNGFNAGLTHEVLSSTEKRDYVIQQMLKYAKDFNVDGINIDFENVAVADGPYFVQFVKEITPYLKNMGLVVSVDMYVPKPWTEHYNRKVLGEVVDYLIIMGYDEHWSTSPVSGSVASINFVTEGVVDTLAVVPHAKVILGLPFYTRLWREETVDGAVKVTSVAYSMNRARAILEENNAEIVWLEDIGQYYGEYTIGGIRYRCWLEEERSISKKVDLVIQHDLAGVAGWRLGLEKPETWDVLYNYLKE